MGEIEPTFGRLRDFVLTDLGRLVSQQAGGQFAVVTLVTAACDALARLRYGKDQGHRIFALCLPEPWEPAAPILYSALRHGLIHAYEPKAIVVDSAPVTFQIAWKGRRHLTFADESRSVLCIVAPDLFEALKSAFARVEEELRAHENARADFLARDRKERVLERHSDAATRAWREAVASAAVVPPPVQPPDPPRDRWGPRLAPGGEGATGARGPAA